MAAVAVRLGVWASGRLGVWAAVRQEVCGGLGGGHGWDRWLVAELGLCGALVAAAAAAAKGGCLLALCGGGRPVNAASEGVLAECSGTGGAWDPEGLVGE